MNANFVKYTLLFVAMVLLQEFVFNNIQVGTLLTPYVYIFLILILPFSYSPSVVLITSFLLGLSVDIVSTESLGMHAAACTVMGYARRFVFKAIRPKDDSSHNTSLTIYTVGWRSFILYTFILVFLHHATLFYLEAFKFANIFYTLLRVILSTLMSGAFIVLIQLAFFKKPHNQV